MDGLHDRCGQSGRGVRHDAHRGVHGHDRCCDRDRVRELAVPAWAWSTPLVGAASATFGELFVKDILFGIGLVEILLFVFGLLDLV